MNNLLIKMPLQQVQMFIAVFLLLKETVILQLILIYFTNLVVFVTLYFTFINISYINCVKTIKF